MHISVGVPRSMSQIDRQYLVIDIKNTVISFLRDLDVPITRDEITIDFDMNPGMNGPLLIFCSSSVVPNDAAVCATEFAQQMACEKYTHKIPA